MATSNKLKAWVRYDGQKKIVPGSLILQAKKPKVGTWEEVPTDLCCSREALKTLRLLFTKIIYADILVGDATNVDDWNAFFDLPNFGSPFVSVEVQGNEVILYGASNITLRYGLFGYIWPLSKELLEVNDEGCVKVIEDAAFENCINLRIVHFPEAVETTYVDYYGAFGDCSSLYNAYLPKLTKYAKDYGAFGNAGFRTPGLVLPFDKFITIDTDYFFDGCSNISEISFPNLVSVTSSWFFNGAPSLTSVDFPKLEYAGEGMFVGCTSLQNISLPNVKYIGDSCFLADFSLTNIYLPSVISLGSTVGNNNVFNGISGNTITLTVPAALMTCNGGQPDGDIQYLQANNTVTVITV